MIKIYEEIFDSTYETLLFAFKDRAKTTPIEQFKCELESYYKYDDLNWTGRSDTKQAEIDATILAYEVFISRSKKEKSEGDT